MQRRFDFRVGHELVPAQLRAVVFDHGHDRALIDREVTRREPALFQIERIVEAVRAPQIGTVSVVVMSQCGKRFV